MRLTVQILSLLELDMSELVVISTTDPHPSKSDGCPSSRAQSYMKWDKGSFAKVVLWGIKFQLYHLEVDSKSGGKTKKLVSFQEGHLKKNG